MKALALERRLDDRFPTIFQGPHKRGWDHESRARARIRSESFYFMEYFMLAGARHSQFTHLNPHTFLRFTLRIIHPLLALPGLWQTYVLV